MGDMFADLAAAYGTRPLFRTDDGAEIAVAALADLTQRPEIAACRGRLVMCLSDNDPGGALGYLALLQAQAVPMMVATGLPTPRLQTLIAAYEPSFLWLPEARMADVPDADLVLSERGYGLLARRTSVAVPLHDDLALLLGTSGSTGSPRFVRLSQGNLLGNARAIRDYLGIGADDVPVTSLPLTYSYGLSVLHSHLLAGSTIALTAKTLFDRGFWDFLRDARVTSFAGVPYHYEMLAKLRFAKMDLPDLRTMTQAGGRMDPALVRDFAVLCAERNRRLFVMYGQTEATARMAYLPPDKAATKPGSIGQAIPGGELWLEDEDGTRVAEPDRPGQLVYRGPNVALGYAESHADLGRGDEWQGLLHTGDLATRDAEGDFTIVGRLKRFVKLFGNRINLQDVEHALQAAGHQAVCGGRDDRLDVYLVDADAEVGKQVKKTLAAELKVTPQAIGVFAIDRVPRNDAGKVLYGLLDGLEKVLLA
ncbi:AMP-binding protein [Novosphingobium sp. JCM 18896]|uniref:AMP-binding protein n=1 Tax=Novosphingobium sp. JCM 18896 TaxID=2989731 RepID=UPI0022213B10|nr:AMP-binding protein [Novosphingobium sp. JCM 18896]MCW1429389.1 AMP-binding protein [Novosphingobium sp. JCM 18896]